jgi:hypothetical protein
MMFTNTVLLVLLAITLRSLIRSQRRYRASRANLRKAILALATTAGAGFTIRGPGVEDCRLTEGWAVDVFNVPCAACQKPLSLVAFEEAIADRVIARRRGRSIPGIICRPCAYVHARIQEMA